MGASPDDIEQQREQATNDDGCTTANPSSSPTTTAAAEDDDHNTTESQYATFSPLLQSMKENEQIRRRAFRCDGWDQFAYPASNVGWCRTLCIIRGRAIHQFIWPWLWISIHAVVVVTLMQQNIGWFRPGNIGETTAEWATGYAFVFNVALR